MKKHVHKFGGTSLAAPDRVRRAIDLVAAEAGIAPVVVVSAFAGVTDGLLTCLEEALNRDRTYKDVIDSIRTRHREAAHALAPDEHDALLSHLDGVWEELTELCDGVYLVRECSPRTRDAVLSAGERASAMIVAAAFRQCGHAALSVDARDLIRTDATHGEAVVDFVDTQRRMDDWLLRFPAGHVAVVTGFIAANGDDVTTTLGRSGSDYTATIIGAAVHADRVVIWTDVDGVLSADPRLVPDAFTLAELSYREAGEMAYFGAKVLHPRTMRPLEHAGIPLFIRNTLNPEAEGTAIRSVTSNAQGQVRAVTAVRDVSILMIEGSGMLGVRGIAARTFQALAMADVNVIVISQASSEQSICIGVRTERAQTARAVLLQEFDRELERRDIASISVQDACAIVSVVGDGMRMKPGLAGRMFSMLGTARINVLAIAQGASETNISAIVLEADLERAIRALHVAFARSTVRIHVVLVGVGTVGRALLQILADRTGSDHNVDIRLVGVCRSKTMLWDSRGIAPGQAVTRLADAGEPYAAADMVDRLLSGHLERTILVDCTASDDMAALYVPFLEHGIGIVTPNKRANTGSLEAWNRLQEVSQRQNVPFLFETTVGAGLPVLSTLRDLVRSGDRVIRIDAILSGTLAYVFNRMGDGLPFPEALREAQDRGFTEPDPAEDLSGEDVARKLLTLARQAGFQVSRSDIQVEPVVADDALWKKRRSDGAWHYVATLDTTHVAEPGAPPRMEVRPVMLTDDSPFNTVRSTDNMVVFTTDRYSERPLVIQGAGAGPVVTAAGVLVDILHAARAMR